MDGESLSTMPVDGIASYLARMGAGVIVGDVRDFEELRLYVEQADTVYHLAAQVAVTTSVHYPRADFEVNALGTLNVLEAARLAPEPPTVFYSSTNKVYGDLPGLGYRVVEEDTRYDFVSASSVSERGEIDLKTPYGCSKGAGDLYALEYARTYGLRTVVFRQSCIYGPWQNGTEDQGWVAHFLYSAMLGRDITIYGDGKQVRDLLYVDDLIDAIRRAVRHANSTTKGKAYNIGGGRNFARSIWSEFKHDLGRHAKPPEINFAGWRPNDQKVYISNTNKAASDFGWRPKVGIEEGLSRMVEWVKTTSAIAAF